MMIYNIPPCYPFMENLVSFIDDKYVKKPTDLADIVIIVPTQRAVLSLKEAFLKFLNGKASLLPTILPIYHLESLDTSFVQPMKSTERLFLLMRLVAKKEPTLTADQSFLLAKALADFLDEFSLNGLSLDSLENVVPDSFSSHWQETLSFLEIIRKYYPQILEEENKLDTGSGKILGIENLARKWKDTPPLTPIIMAGFTGGLPVVRKMMNIVRNLPKGTVVLDGLYQDLSDEEWKEVTATHAQFDLKLLLDEMKLKPAEIPLLPNLKNQTSSKEREKLIYESLKPAELLEEWVLNKDSVDTKSLDHLTFFEYETMEEEAKGIALKLREVLETPHKTAALVTSDRKLARHVRAEMRRWNIILDDSAGYSFADTPTGVFLLLLVNYAASGQTDAQFLSLMKHPLATNTLSQSACRASVYEFETNKRKSLTDGLDFSSSEVTENKEQKDLLKVSLPLCDLFREKHSFSEFLSAHLESAENLAQSNDRTGAERLWNNENQSEIQNFIAEIQQVDLPNLTGKEYAELIETLFKGLTLRPKYAMHPRLDILGPIEARLQNPDLVIIGEVNDGVWPTEPTENPWINRPMRVLCGLPAEEEKIGLNAHDYVHNLMRAEVVLTRSLKKDGTPTLPSPYVLRLQALMKAKGHEFKPSKDNLVALLDKEPPYEPIEFEPPSPPLEERPQSFSATDLEKLRQDPYGIYAKRILRLKKLPSLLENTSRKDYGMVIHSILQQFIDLPKEDRNFDILLKIGEKVITSLIHNKVNQVFFLSKFQKIATEFWKEEVNSPFNVRKSLTEETLSADISTAHGCWNLHAKCDRIDILEDGRVRIIDYKTGEPPNKGKVLLGYAPQLSVEGLLSEKGDLKKEVVALEYWHLGAANKMVSSYVPEEELEQHISDTEQGIRNLIDYYALPTASYDICPAEEYAPKYNDYEYLERLDKEGDV